MKRTTITYLALALAISVTALWGSTSSADEDQINCKKLTPYDPNHYYHAGDIVYWKTSSVVTTGAYKCKSICSEKNAPSPGSIAWEFVGKCFISRD
jgi:hypothetical protein